MNQNNPLVTIYITNYNYASYLSLAIESVLAQSISSFELFVIDDGSTDNSREIIKKYEQVENVHIVFQNNKGLIASNNLALKMARGKYFIRLDADDYLAPQALEIMAGELQRNPECALVFPDYYLIDENDEIIAQHRRHDFRKQVSLMDQPAHGACTMICTDILKAVGGYDRAFTCQDGYDLWLKIVRNYQVRNINLPLFYYRQHPKSLTRNEENILATRAKIKEKHVENNNLDPLKVLAVLPVRGCGLDPRSNPLSFLGEKRLIDWTITAALESDKIDKVAVTTPDRDLISYLEDQYQDKLMLIEREIELARINTPVEETALHALKEYCGASPSPDAILMLYIEFPFRSTMYMDKAINTMLLYDVDVVDGVIAEDDMFYVHSGHGLEPWNKREQLRLERDELYRRAGGIHLIKRTILEQQRDMLGGRIGHIIIDQQAAVSTRTEMSLELAKMIAKRKTLR